MSTAFAHVARAEVENIIAIAHVGCAAEEVVSTIQTVPALYVSTKAEPTTRIAVVPRATDVASSAPVTMMEAYHGAFNNRGQHSEEEAGRKRETPPPRFWSLYCSP
jgi:hypothetical protein